jgi:hypothetical protein
MPKYILSFRSDPRRTVSAEDESAWGAWFQQIGASIADPGHRVGRSRALGDGASGAGRALELGGYVLIEAKSLEAASSVAEGCPGLRSGGAVEVGELLET